MPNEKKSKLIASVESGNGIKILSGLKARVSYTDTYYVVVDYKNQVQADYMYENYSWPYRKDNNKVNYLQIRTEDDSEIGLFMTDKKIDLHSLLKSLIEDENMTVLSGKEKFSNKYDLDDSKRLESNIPTEADVTITEVNEANDSLEM